MDRKLTATEQEMHKKLVAELQLTFRLKEEAQLEVNAAIRNLRAKERKIATLAAEISEFEQLRLTLQPKEQDER